MVALMKMTAHDDASSVLTKDTSHFMLMPSPVKQFERSRQPGFTFKDVTE